MLSSIRSILTPPVRPLQKQQGGNHLGVPYELTPPPPLMPMPPPPKTPPELLAPSPKTEDANPSSPGNLYRHPRLSDTPRQPKYHRRSYDMRSPSSQGDEPSPRPPEEVRAIPSSSGGAKQQQHNAEEGGGSGTGKITTKSRYDRMKKAR